MTSVTTTVFNRRRQNGTPTPPYLHPHPTSQPSRRNQSTLFPFSSPPPLPTTTPPPPKKTHPNLSSSLLCSSRPLFLANIRENTHYTCEVDVSNLTGGLAGSLKSPLCLEGREVKQMAAGGRRGFAARHVEFILQLYRTKKKPGEEMAAS